MVDSNAGLEFSVLSRSRAIENARSFIMVSNTGPTVAYNPLGQKVLTETKLLTPDVGFVDLPIYTEKTLYSYVYAWPSILLALFSFIYGLLKIRLRKNSA